MNSCVAIIVLDVRVGEGGGKGMDVLLFAQLTIVCILCNFGGNATPCQGVARLAFQKQSTEIAKRVRKMARIGLNWLKKLPK